jgi:hypothetical protein
MKKDNTEYESRITELKKREPQTGGSYQEDRTDKWYISIFREYNKFHAYGNCQASERTGECSSFNDKRRRVDGTGKRK